MPRIAPRQPWTPAPRHEPEAPAPPSAEPAVVSAEDLAERAIREQRWDDVAAAGSTAVPVLRRFLEGELATAYLPTEHDNGSARRVLAELASGGDRPAIEALLTAASGAGLSELGESVLDHLTAIARAEGAEAVRFAAIEVIGEMGEARSARTLNEIRAQLTSGRPALRLLGATERALRRCGWATLDEEARRHLTEDLVLPQVAILRDPKRQGEWRRAATELAQTVLDGAAAEAVVSFIAGTDGQRQYRDWQDAVSFAEEHLLAPHLRSRSTKALAPFLVHTDRAVRDSACGLLARLGWEPSGGDSPRWLIARGQWDEAAALGVDALEALLDEIRGSDSRAVHLARAAREAASEAVARIDDRRAVEALAGLLGDENAGLRLAAARALGGMGDGRGAEVLVAAFRDGSSSGQRPAYARLLARCGAAAGLVETLSGLEARGAALLSGPGAPGVVPFLRDAAPHLTHCGIQLYSRGSAWEGFGGDSERWYDEPGFRLGGAPGSRDALWLLASGDLLQVTTIETHSDGGGDWRAVAERGSPESFAADPGWVRSSLQTILLDLVEQRSLVAAATAPAE